MSILKDLSLLVSVWEVLLPNSAMLISRQQVTSTTLRLLHSVVLELETKNGLLGLTVLPNQLEFISEEILSLSFLVALLLFAIISKLELQLFVSLDQKSVDIKIKLKLKKRPILIMNLLRKLWSIRMSLLMEISKEFWTTSMDTRKLSIILSLADLNPQ